MKKLLFILTAFLFSFSLIFAQEAAPSEPEFIPESEEDYIDEQNMTVTEVEELIQSQSAINRLDLFLALRPLSALTPTPKIPTENL